MNLPIGTKFKISFSEDVYEVRTPFTPSKELIHFRNLSDGVSGVTIPQFITIIDGGCKKPRLVVKITRKPETITRTIRVKRCY